MKTVILNLGEKFNGMRIPIDASSFSFYGHVAETELKDARISFIPIQEGRTAEEIAEDIRNVLKYNVDKSKYAGMRIPYEHESDQRLRVWVRLPSGYGGISEPSMFHLQPAEA